MKYIINFLKENCMSKFLQWAFEKLSSPFQTGAKKIAPAKKEDINPSNSSYTYGCDSEDDLADRIIRASAAYRIKSSQVEAPSDDDESSEDLEFSGRTYMPSGGFLVLRKGRPGTPDPNSDLEPHFFPRMYA